MMSKEQALETLGIKGVTTSPKRISIKNDKYKGFEVVEEKSEELKTLEDFAPQLLLMIIRFTTPGENVQIEEARELVLKATQKKVDIFEKEGQKYG